MIIIYRNIEKKIAAVRKVDKKLAQQIMDDIAFLQWSCHSEETFRVVFDLLEKKYQNINEQTDNFFEYFREQWGPDSHVSRWYEGAHPWAISNNSGIEGINKAIKKDHTFKRRCPLGTFILIVNRMVT